MDVEQFLASQPGHRAVAEFLERSGEAAACAKFLEIHQQAAEFSKLARETLARADDLLKKTALLILEHAGIRAGDRYQDAQGNRFLLDSEMRNAVPAPDQPPYIHTQLMWVAEEGRFRMSIQVLLVKATSTWKKQRGGRSLLVLAQRLGDIPELLPTGIEDEFKFTRQED